VIDVIAKTLDPLPEPVHHRGTAHRPVVATFEVLSYLIIENPDIVPDAFGLALQSWILRARQDDSQRFLEQAQVVPQCEQRRGGGKMEVITRIGWHAALSASYNRHHGQEAPHQENYISSALSKGDDRVVSEWHNACQRQESRHVDLA